MNFCDFVKNNLLNILIIFLLISILVFILVDKNNNCKIKEGLDSDDKHYKDSWKKAINVILICFITFLVVLIIGLIHAVSQKKEKSYNILDGGKITGGVYSLTSEEFSSNDQFYTPDSK